MVSGGGKETRTPDPKLAKLVLYQLSYTPVSIAHRLWHALLAATSVARSKVVGLRGLEPLTSRLSGVCSNHLSYKPG